MVQDLCNRIGANRSDMMKLESSIIALATGYYDKLHETNADVNILYYEDLQELARTILRKIDNIKIVSATLEDVRSELFVDVRNVLLKNVRLNQPIS